MLMFSTSCHVHAFPAPAGGGSAAPFLFFAFLPFRSLFFKPTIPALHTSAYRMKNPSISSGLTIVLSFTLVALAFFPFPSVACINIGRGSVMLRSEKSSTAGFGLAGTSGL